MPTSIVKTRRNDEYMDVGSLSSVKLYFWKDESWSIEYLSANYSQNDSNRATPYFLIPVSEGKYSVYIECEGFQAVKAKDGPNDGKMSGFITYSEGQNGWMARAYTGCTISNYRATDSKVAGHPDLEVNGCNVTDQLVERDFYCSFHLDATGDGYFALQAPPIEKSDHHNFVVSYGNFTNKTLEWGSVSISIDEVNTTEAHQRSNRDKTAGGNSRLGAVLDLGTYESTIDKPAPRATESTEPKPSPALAPRAAAPEPQLKISDKPDPKIQNWLNSLEDESVVDEVLNETVYAPPKPPSLKPTSEDTLRQADKVRRALMANASQNSPPKDHLVNVETSSTFGGSLQGGSLHGGSLQGGSLRGGSLGGRSSRPPLPTIASPPRGRSVSPPASMASTLRGGSLSGGSLRGGNINVRREMTREESREYTRLRNSMGKTAARNYADSINAKYP